MAKQAEPFLSNKALSVPSGKQISLAKEKKQKTLSNVEAILFHFCILHSTSFLLFFLFSSSFYCSCARNSEEETPEVFASKGLVERSAEALRK